MNKPEYELSPLKAGVIQAKLNIAAFERGIHEEEDRIKEYQGYIKQWEEYNRQGNDNTGRSNIQS